MISIVIPLFNKEKYIGETLNSLINQTYNNFEIVIVNDGSTDNSLSIISSYKDERVRILNIKNSGVSIARNIGINEAKYNWIAFLDADDYWSPLFLEEIVKLIELHPKFKVFSTGRSTVYNNDKFRYSNEFLPKDGNVGVLSYFKIISKFLPLVNSSNSVINKDLLMKNGLFNPSQTQHEDHDLWMRICIDEKVVFINKDLSFYRKNIKDSASNRLMDSKDFISFINTMIFVNDKLNINDKKYFKKYYNNFLILMYIKCYKNYTKEEDLLVTSKIKVLISGNALLILNFLIIFPYKDIYKLLKAIKK